MYYDALMLREGNLTKAEKEMIVVATSSANNCMYCIVAHGALLRIYSKNPLLGDQVKISLTKLYLVAQNSFQHLHFDGWLQPLFITCGYNRGIKKLPNHW